jgi:hypothetical protein
MTPLARSTTFALALSVLMSCATTPRFTSPDQLDIAEQVFRSLVGDDASSSEAKPAVLCFTGSRSPDAAFMARFHDLRRPIHACAEGGAGLLKGTDVPEYQLRATHQPALKFSLNEIVLTSPTQATAKAIYYEASESFGGYVLELEKTAKGWVVLKRDLEWLG